MKMSRRIVSLAVCVVMLLSLSVVAFAASSRTFFVGTYNGYTCTGKGSIDGTTGTATFTASVNEDLPHVPSEDCSCTVWVLAHDSNGQLLGASTSNGTIYAKATYIASATIYDTYCTFEFMGSDLGGYILYK